MDLHKPHLDIIKALYCCKELLWNLTNLRITIIICTQLLHQLYLFCVWIVTAFFQANVAVLAPRAALLSVTDFFYRMPNLKLLVNLGREDYGNMLSFREISIILSGEKAGGRYNKSHAHAGKKPMVNGVALQTLFQPVCN